MIWCDHISLAGLAIIVNTRALFDSENMLFEVSLIYFYIFIVVFIPLMTFVGEIEAAIKMQGE